MLIAIIRAREGHYSNYALPLSTKQREALDAFTTALRTENNATVPLEDFLFSICEEQPLMSEECLWTCPVQCYWAVRALRDDGNFIPPEIFTGWLSKTKYLCVMTAALDAVRHKQEYPNGLIG